MPLHASLAHARRNIGHSQAIGAAPVEGTAEESQRPAKARLACPDCLVQRRGSWHQRDHAAERQVEAMRLALAGALYGRRR